MAPLDLCVGRHHQIAAREQAQHRGVVARVEPRAGRRAPRRGEPPQDFVLSEIRERRHGDGRASRP
ncbi:MAG: hypothetical protein HY076_00715 [Candidatus Eisenbacteria bacterium]|uniref:Uncharacterized protein n=1 Tax=Eiseniibacteriota bacterium TaxID=2212470 RepID=A0A9D6L2W4_UNCEI|nr:hypothetical protein [Candidatus Eisenbacteria bacterium]